MNYLLKNYLFTIILLKQWIFLLSLSIYIYILLYLLYRLQLILFPTLFLIYFLYYYAEEDEFLFEIDRDEYIVDLANGMINI